MILNVRKQIEENFDFSLFKSSNLFNLAINFITFHILENREETLFKKSKELVNFMLKIDVELFLRINPSIRKVNYDAFTQMNDKLNQLFFELTDSKILNK